MIRWTRLWISLWISSGDNWDHCGYSTLHCQWLLLRGWVSAEQFIGQFAFGYWARWWLAGCLTVCGRSGTSRAAGVRPRGRRRRGRRCLIGPAPTPGRLDPAPVETRAILEDPGSTSLGLPRPSSGSGVATSTDGDWARSRTRLTASWPGVVRYSLHLNVRCSWNCAVLRPASRAGCPRLCMVDVRGSSA